jgi:non-heme chloroperoxidase
LRQYLLLGVMLALVLPTTALKALDISGTWQGLDKTRHVLKIRKVHGSYVGELYNLGDESYGATRNGNTVSAFNFDGGFVRFSLDNTEGAFRGKLAEDGKTIIGTWQPMFGPAHALTFARANKQTEWVIDPSPHEILFVTVQKGVKLEVLDWGGIGPPLILLAGLGNTAHEFDDLAPKFTGKHHVFAITRRGFGLSGSPAFTDENYDSDRLGDDVLAVMTTLEINKPVLAGHSQAGEELSSVGTRHPEKIAGLVYLDSLFQYAFYDPTRASLDVETAIVKRDLSEMFELQNSPIQWRALIAEVQAHIPPLQKAMQETVDMLEGAPETPPMNKPNDLAANRIVANTRPYGVASVPVLAILAMPRQCQPGCDKALANILGGDIERADLFERETPNVRVVRLPHASHYVWRSNEADVLREMNAFMDGLPN